MAQDWQPIETAPKDGTVVMLWWLSEFGRETVSFYATGFWKEFGDGSKGWIGESFHASEPDYWTRLLCEKPTHWMPLPPPPARRDDPMAQDWQSLTNRLTKYVVVLRGGASDLDDPKFLRKMARDLEAAAELIRLQASPSPRGVTHE